MRGKTTEFEWEQKPGIGKLIIPTLLELGMYNVSVTFTPVEPELKPCPFCGAQPSLFGGNTSWASWVQCEGCNSYSGHKRTRALAIAAWNRRADE